MGDSSLVQKGLPCPDCGSSDALALYDDDHTHCFSCSRTRSKGGDGAPRKVPKATADLEEAISQGSPRAIPDRKLTQATCLKWGYIFRQSPNGLQHMAVYRDASGKPVGIKLRSAGKKFSWIGESHGQLFGRHLWGSGGKKVVITEGEIDAMTVSQAQDHLWPVVSIPNGAAEAAKSIAKNLEWLNSFDQIVLGFDMDEPGRDAAEECAKILPVGKAFIVKWKAKDASEMLVNGQGADITRCIWQAEAYRPDGILDARSLTAECLIPPTMGLPWPWRFMTNWTLGRHYGRSYAFGAGFGLGKSDYLAEIIASTISGETREGDTFTPEAFAVFSYEGGAARVKQNIAGKLARRRFQFPPGHPDCMWTQDELVAVHARMDGPIWDAGGKLFILDSKGAADWDRAKETCRYLRHAEGVRHFLFDPLGAMVMDEDDERKFLDRMILELTQLAVELDACMYVVSHLTRPKDGPPHEEGGQVRGAQFRGSNGIGQFISYAFGLERNQQAESLAERCTTKVRVVKDRDLGNSAGLTENLHYDQINGLLDPCQEAILGDDVI